VTFVRLIRQDIVSDIISPTVSPYRCFRQAHRLAAAESWEFYKKLDRTHATWHEFRKRRAASLLEGLASAAIVKVGALTREGGALYTVRSLFVRARQEVMTASSRHEVEELPGEHSAHVSERVEVCQGISYHNYFRLRQTVRMLELNAAQSRHRTR